MDTKEIDGIEYVKKAEVENIIKQRVDKVAQRANESEQVAKELRQKLETASKADSTIDLLTQQIEKMKGELHSSEQKYSRFQSMSKHGFNDPDIIDAIEWSYEKSQSGKEKGEVEALSQWLDNIVTDPTTAPKILRPHLEQRSTVEATEAPQGATIEPASTESQLAELQRTNEQRPAPQTNRNVRQAPEPSNIIERGLKDPDFYAQNRSEIRNAWLSRNRER